MSKDPPILCGIDIGSSKVVTVIASVDEARVSVLGIASIPSRGVHKGQIVDLRAATEVIEKSVAAAERESGINVTNAFVSVGGTSIESTKTHAVVAARRGYIAAPDLERLNEIATSCIPIADKQILHTFPISYSLDNQQRITNPLRMFGTRLETDIHIVSTSAVALQNIQKCLEKVGIGSRSVVFSGVASAQAILTDTERKLGAVSVELVTLQQILLCTLHRFLYTSRYYQLVQTSLHRILRQDLKLPTRKRRISRLQVCIKTRFRQTL